MKSKLVGLLVAIHFFKLSCLYKVRMLHCIFKRSDEERVRSALTAGTSFLGCYWYYPQGKSTGESANQFL